MKVDIFIETNNAIQKKQLHRYGFVLEAKYRGRLITAEGFGEADETFHGTVLTALNEAVQRLLGKCELSIHARDPYILQALVNQVPEWKAAGWIRSNGEPVKHADLWKSITDRLQELQIEIIGANADRHEYSSWIQGEMKKQAMKEDVLDVVR